MLPSLACHSRDQEKSDALKNENNFAQKDSFEEILYYLMKDPKILCLRSVSVQDALAKRGFVHSNPIQFLRTFSGPPELASERTD